MTAIKMCNCCHEVKEHASSRSSTCNECLSNGLKWCSSCETVKPIEDFNKNGNTIRSVCKECDCKRASQNRARPEYKEYIKEYSKEYYDRPEVKERISIQKKHYYDRPEVRERIRVQQKQHYAKPEVKERTKGYYNRPEVKEHLKEYYDRPDVKEHKRVQSAEYKRRQYATEEGRQKELMRCHNRRTKIQGTVTLAEWNETLEYFNNACAYCGSTGKITQDHIVPIASGGLNTKYNLVPACQSCNCSKNSRPLVQWYMKQPFATEERLQKVLDFMQKA